MERTSARLRHARRFRLHDLDRDDIPEAKRAVKRVVDVPKYRLDAYIEHKRLPLPDVMKLDCQGAEEVILEGAVDCLRTADVVLLETWLTREYGPRTPLLTEIVAFLDGTASVWSDSANSL